MAEVTITSIGASMMTAHARKISSNYIFKVRANIDFAGVGDSGSKLHGGSKGGSIMTELWQQKEFPHVRQSVKVPSLRGNAEWHMHSGACLPDLIEQCEKMYAKRFGGDKSAMDMYDVVIVQAYGNDMFPTATTSSLEVGSARRLR